MQTKNSQITPHERPAKIDHATKSRNEPKGEQSERSEIHTLEIQNLHANIGELKILNGINLIIRSREIHAIMGPNGSGKSTLCNVLMGHPKYTVTKGSAKFNGKEILKLEPNERANLGLFLGFQHPIEVAGVSLGTFLRLANRANESACPPKAWSSKNTHQPLNIHEFNTLIKEKFSMLKMDEKFITRSVNEGFSGGEKKRAEIVQMAVLGPKIAMLDEIDSGLDIDALKIVAKGIVETFKKTGLGLLLITHYQRLLNYITPDFVHVMAKGKIVQSGDKKLAKKLEKEGYEQISQHLTI